MHLKSKVKLNRECEIAKWRVARGPPPGWPDPECSGMRSCTISVGVSWELVRNANPWASPRTGIAYERVRGGSGNRGTRMGSKEAGQIYTYM